MKSINIKLSLAENVKSFVNVVSRYPYDMDLRAGRHVVDAKSVSYTHLTCSGQRVAPSRVRGL